jgi:hypothetical protein
MRSTVLVVAQHLLRTALFIGAAAVLAMGVLRLR